MPKNQKNQKKQQIQEKQKQETQEEIIKNSFTQVFKDNIKESCIDYLIGTIEEEDDDLQDILTSTDRLGDIIFDFLEDKYQMKNEQIYDYAQKIVTLYCQKYSLSQQDSQNQKKQQKEEEKLDANELEELEKEKLAKIEKLKSNFGEISDDLDDIDWDEDTIKQFEQLKIDQEKAIKFGCVLCERITPLTFHHLIPRTTHSRPYNKGKSKTELNVGIWICRQCHSGIHGLIDEETMAKEYYTYELVIAHEGVLKMAKYMNKQKISHKQDKRSMYGDQYLTKNGRDKL